MPHGWYFPSRCRVPWSCRIWTPAGSCRPRRRSIDLPGCFDSCASPSTGCCIVLHHAMSAPSSDLASLGMRRHGACRYSRVSPTTSLTTLLGWAATRELSSTLLCRMLFRGLERLNCSFRHLTVFPLISEEQKSCLVPHSKSYAGHNYMVGHWYPFAIRCNHWHSFFKMCAGYRSAVWKIWIGSMIVGLI